MIFGAAFLLNLGWYKRRTYATKQQMIFFLILIKQCHLISRRFEQVLSSQEASFIVNKKFCYKRDSLLTFCTLLPRNTICYRRTVQSQAFSKLKQVSKSCETKIYQSRICNLFVLTEHCELKRNTFRQKMS